MIGKTQRHATNQLLAVRLPDTTLVEVADGVVVAVSVVIGDRVAAGSEVATVEALKMQHAVVAPGAGKGTR